MAKIVVLDAFTANPGDISWQPWHELGELQVYDRTHPSQVIERIGDAEVVLTNKVVLSADVLAHTPSVRYIGVTATGYNVVDLDDASRRGIVVTNIPAYSTDSVAQMVFAHLLHIARHVSEHAAAVRQGAWSGCQDFCFWQTPQLELSGMRMGLVGLGHTGMATARIAQSFGMEVLAYTSRSAEELPEGIRKVAMDDLFAQSDVLSLHCPLTADTHHLVDARRLALMQPSAILINTGRGPLIDEQALSDALIQGRLFAAGLDVLEQEPPVSGSPLLTAPRCYITPHIAWATTASRRRLMQVAFDNVVAYLSGRPQHQVNL